MIIYSKGQNNFKYNITFRYSNNDNDDVYEQQVYGRNECVRGVQYYYNEKGRHVDKYREI